MSECYNSGFSPGDRTKLKHRIHEIEPFLEYDEFTVREVDDDRAQHTVKVLKRVGAVEVDRRKLVSTQHGGKRTPVWTWNAEYKEYLKDYRDNLDQFPCCGHKIRVYNPRHAEELACPGCETEYSKEWVKQYL